MAWAIFVPDSTSPPANTSGTAKPLDKVFNSVSRMGIYGVSSSSALASLLTALSAAGEDAPSTTKPVWAHTADTGILYKNTGSGWVEQLDERTLDQSNTVATTVGSGTAVSHIRHGMVSLVVNIASAGLTNGSLTTVATIAAAYRPAAQVGGGAYLSGYGGALLVNTDGTVQISNQTGATRNAVYASAVWPEA